MTKIYKFFSFTLFLLSFFVLTTFFATPTYAQSVCGGPLTDPCSSVSVGGSCSINGAAGTCSSSCTCVPTTPANPPGGDNPSSVFGTVKPPVGVDKFNALAGGGSGGSGTGIGIVIFISNIIKLATIVAGIIVFINFILAGFTYITSDGNASANDKVKNQVTMSVLGLILIIASYTIIAILSFLLFGKPDYILNPHICGPNGGAEC
jgi:hypothetical protein